MAILVTETNSYTRIRVHERSVPKAPRNCIVRSRVRKIDPIETKQTTTTNMNKKRLLQYLIGL